MVLYWQLCINSKLHDQQVMHYDILGVEYKTIQLNHIIVLILTVQISINNT
jgi:hypothetical protein